MFAQEHSNMLRVNETAKYVEQRFFTSGMYNKRGEIQVPPLNKKESNHSL
jgi:hypothetical protein